MPSPKRLAALLLLAAASAGLLAAPASACSVTDDYRVPTNLQLAAEAEVIVLARVESGASGTEGLGASITVVPIELLKGRLPLGEPLVLPGSIAEPRFAVLSNPLQLEQAHPLAYIGACLRTMFVRGATVLFFLTPAEKAFDGRAAPAGLRGRMLPAGGPFSRWAEDVLAADSPWVRATRIYVAAAALPADRRKALLADERNRLRASPDSESRLIAQDIDRQLAGPNKGWNQLMREEIRKMRKRGKDPLGPLGD